MRAPWTITLILLSAVAADRSARADIPPPPPVACEKRAAGERCYDSLGRPGRCVPEAQWSGGRCSLTEESATPEASSMPAATSSAPEGERASSGNGSSGCSAPPQPLAAGGAWVIAVLALLATRQRRR